jgi:hypothetical protein
MDIQSVKLSFINYLQGNSSTAIVIAHFPDLLLNMAIKAAMGHRINEKPINEVLDSDKFYSVIYQEWKLQFRLIISSYSENSKVNMTFGENNVTPKNVYDHRIKFEELFSVIDGQQIFEEIDYSIY